MIKGEIFRRFRVKVMTVSPTSTPVAARTAVPPEPVVPLTVEQYHEMARAGILLGGDPIELLEGWLVIKMTKHPLHSACTAKTRRQLDRIVPDGWSVDSQEPITTDDSEPEPDVAVIRGHREDYTERHPGPDDVGLLVEVADTSLQRDRGWKRRVYATAGISVFWIVNLIDREVEVMSRPTGPAQEPDYGNRQVFRPGDEVRVVLDGVEVGRIAVADLLP
jgi:Uma2 family endonuclease